MFSVVIKGFNIQELLQVVHDVNWVIPELFSINDSQLGGGEEIQPSLYVLGVHTWDQASEAQYEQHQKCENNVQCCKFMHSRKKRFSNYE